MASLLHTAPQPELLTRYNIKESSQSAGHLQRRDVWFKDAKILVAEDNPVNQHVATSLLAKFGCLPVITSDGAEAVAQIKEKRFDLVFMDCQMPNMDGYEATQAIRKWESTARSSSPTVIVALTANAMKGDSEKCLASGMDDYLAKPLKPKELQDMLLKWLPVDKQAENPSKGAAA